MKIQKSAQIQVRIDPVVKENAKKVLEEIGMDTSTVVNILFKQIAKTGVFPIDLRDVNGFRSQKALELSESISEVSQTSKTFKNTKDIMADLRS